MGGGKKGGGGGGKQGREEWDEREYCAALDEIVMKVERG